MQTALHVFDPPADAHRRRFSSDDRKKREREKLRGGYFCKLDDFNVMSILMPFKPPLAAKVNYRMIQSS